MRRNQFLKMLAFTPFVSLLTAKAKASPIRKNEMVEFTPDILKAHNVGLYLINNKADVFKRPDYSATVAWKVVYQIDRKDLPHYGMCNFLTDGWTHFVAETHQDMCDWLNHNQYGEKFRIMTKEELNHIINSRSNIKQLVR